MVVTGDLLLPTFTTIYFGIKTYDSDVLSS